MSVADQIGRLAQNLVASRNMVTQKNGRVGSLVAFDNLADEIMSITASQGEQVLVDDTDTAYRKSILNGAQKYAKLKSISGMTYKCNNLIPFPYDGTKGDGYTTTHNGITFVVSGDGSVTCNGTATKKAVFYLLNVSPLPADVTYDNVTMSGCPAGGSATTYYFYNLTTGHKEYGTPVNIAGFKGAYCRFAICVESGTTVTNLVFKPMVNFGREALPYEPYFEGLRDTKVTAIKSYGANLIPFPYAGGKGAGHTENVKGIDIKINKDGSLTIKGTATAAAYFYLQNNCDYGEKTINAMSKESATNGSYTASKRLYYNAINKTLTMNINKGVTVDEIVYPMLNLGTTAAPYKPYREPITYIIPEALQGSGKGVAGYYDTTDFENGKDIKKTETYVFTGNEGWTSYTSGVLPSGAYCYWNANGKPNGKIGAFTSVCDRFENMDKAWDYAPYTGVYSDHHTLNRVYFVTSKPTVDEWKAYLAEQYTNGTPVTLTYALAEPIETDLTETIGNIIEIEEGGFLEFVNEHENAMPTHISYLRRL